MHHFQLVGLLTHHLVFLLAHGEPRVEQVGHAEQNTGKREVVAYEPDVLTPLNNRVERGKVLHPQETLAAQLNGVGHVVEHGNPDGHLYDGRQASAKRAYAILRVHLHHGLLFLHLVLRLVKLFGGLVKLWFQHAHLGRAHVAPFHQGECDDLEQQCDENEHNAHVEAEFCEPVKHIDGKPAVDDANERPTQINKPLHLQVLAEGALFLHLLQQTEVVGTIVELKLRRFLARGVERGFQLGCVLLQVVRFFLQRQAGHERVLGKIVLGNHHGREILVLEGHPVYGFLYGLVHSLFHFVQIVGAALGQMVGERRTLVLKVESALLLPCLVGPFYVHLRVVRRKHALHTHGLHLHVQHIVAPQQPVDDQLPSVARIGRHGDGGVGLVRWGEEQVRADDVLLLSRQHEFQFLVFLLKERHLVLALMVFEVLQQGFRHGAALGGERQFHLLVFQHHVGSRAVHSLEESRC